LTPDGDDPPPPYAAHHGHRSARPHLRGRVARDLEHQDQVVCDTVAELVGSHLEQGHVVRARAGDHHMVDLPREAIEELRERVGVSRIDGGRAAHADFCGGLLEPLGVARQEDHLGAFRMG
jgi:hypothetical protein